MGKGENAFYPVSQIFFLVIYSLDCLFACGFNCLYHTIPSINNTEKEAF